MRYDVETTVEFSEWLTARVLIDYEADEVTLLKLWYGPEDLGELLYDFQIEHLHIPVSARIQIELDAKEILETSGRWVELEPLSVPEDDEPRIVRS